MPSEFLLPFVKKERVAKDTYTFYFDRGNTSAKGGPASGWDFIAGQYNTITLPHQNPDARGIERFFSISSSPHNREFLTITTKISQSTFKQKLMQLQPGEEVLFNGPRGNFVLKEQDGTYVFLVGGIGVTPLMSILHCVDEEKLPTKITLLASFSTVEEVIHYKEFKEIEARNQNIKVIYTITHQEEPVQLWIGETGRISEELIKKYVPDIQIPYFYIVGPPAMVTAMLEMVNSMGIQPEKIVKENFTGY